MFRISSLSRKIKSIVYQGEFKVGYEQELQV